MLGLRIDMRVAGFAALLCFAALVAPGLARAACGWSGYSYAGLESAERANGVAATVAALAEPHVESGHVAAWVGVGGLGSGPGGADEWIQAGIATRKSGLSKLYVEWKAPGASRRYLQLPRRVVPSAGHRLAVAELPADPGVWQAFIDGRPIGRAVALRGSHGRFRPVVTAESWDGGRPACNRFVYSFEDVALADAAGAWRGIGRMQAIEAPGYRLVRRARSSFVARMR